MESVRVLYKDNPWLFKGQPFTSVPTGAYGFLYVMKLPNGKFYIGQKKFDKLHQWKSYYGGGRLMIRYADKHGRHTIKRLMLMLFDTRDELDKAEEQLISITKANQSDLYLNLVVGGKSKQGNTHTPETLDKISKASKEMWKRGGHRENHAEKMRPILDSDEYKQKQGQDSRLRWANADYREKMKHSLSTPEFKANHSKRTKEGMHKPESWAKFVAGLPEKCKKMRKIVVVNGTEYLGIQAVADAYGVKYGLVQSWLLGRSKTYMKHGIVEISYKELQLVSPKMKGVHCEPIVVNDCVVFPNLESVSKHFGVDISTVSGWLRGRTPNKNRGIKSVRHEGDHNGQENLETPCNDGVLGPGLRRLELEPTLFDL